MTIEIRSNSDSQKAKRQFRLLMLLVLYPIYKTIEYFVTQNYLMGAIMFLISAIYLGSVVVLLRKKLI